MLVSFRKSLGGLVATAALVAAQPAAADVISFSCISGPADCSTVIAAQMSVNVQSVNSTTASFTFTNVGGFPSVITQIYWDTALLSSISIGSQTGVSFAVPASPGNFPEGNTIAFNEVFAAKADAPPPNNGIRNSAGDSLVVNGTLASGQTFSSLLASFAAGNTRIGIHVQGITGFGGSDSLVTSSTTTVVPVPGALPLMATGLLAIGYLARRRKQG